MNDRPSFLDFKRDNVKGNTIVPPMKDRLGGSYAETRTELEAKKRAEEEEQRRLILERQVEALRMQSEAEYKKKRSGLVAWGIIMTILFLIGGAGTAYFFIFNQKAEEKVSNLNSEIIKLKNDKTDLETKLETSEEIVETFERYYDLEFSTTKDIPAEVWAGIKEKEEAMKSTTGADGAEDFITEEEKEANEAKKDAAKTE